MNYSEILQSVKEGLTGDIKTDLPYLEQQAEKYKDHKLSKQLIEEISKMAFEILPEDKKQQVGETLFCDGKRLDMVYNEAQVCIENKNFKEADVLLNKLTSKLTAAFKETETEIYFSFRNPFEDCLYNTLYTVPKKILKTPFDFSEIFRTQGYVEVELRKFDKAIMSLRKAIKYNPVNAAAYFELTEAYKVKNDNEEMFKAIMQNLKIASSTSIISRCYTNLGFYCVNLKDYTSAVAFYYQSLLLADDPKVIGELNYIKNQTGKDIEQPDNVVIEAAFNKYNVPLGPNPTIIQIAYKLGHFAKEHAQEKMAQYCLGIAADLSNDEKIKAEYEEIRRSAIAHSYHK